MNGSEIMLDAVNGIAPDLVDEAAGYRFKRNGTNALAWAAAACLMLGVGAAMAAAMLPRLAGDAPDQTAEATPVPTPDITAMRIIEGTGRIEEILIDDEKNPGTVYLLGTLGEAVRSESNEDCLFSVNVHFFNCASEERGKQAEEIRTALEKAYEDPAYIELSNTFGTIGNRLLYFAREGEQVPQGYIDQNAMIIYMNDEEYALYQEKGIPGELLVMLNHSDEIGVSLSEEQKKAYKEAAWNVIGAIEEYEGPHFFEITDAIRSAFENEAKKLIEKGLCIELSTMEIPPYRSAIGGVMCHAYLTADQIINFPSEPDEIYCVYFSSERVDELPDTD